MEVSFISFVNNLMITFVQSPGLSHLHQGMLQQEEHQSKDVNKHKNRTHLHEIKLIE